MVVTSSENWIAENLRFTAFVNTPHKPNVGLWRKITGRHPDSTVNQIQQSAQQENGAFGLGQLIVAQQPGRVDLVYAANPPSSVLSGQPALVQIGAWPDAVSEFSKIVLKFLSYLKNASRIAYAPIVFFKANSLADAIERGSAFLPKLELEAKNTRDFLYQVNRVRKSSVDQNISINRLMKWQTLEMQLLYANQTPSANPIASSYLFRLELDINTIPHSAKPVTQLRLAQLYDELKQNALEIIANGDIK